MNRLSPDPPPEQPTVTVERIEELIHEVRGHLDRLESAIKAAPLLMIAGCSPQSIVQSFTNPRLN
ncbi:MAG: hypothetical protein IT428_32480 [Planctomycetaceae bacterium]|nr:hypothetical protein [Planctomycetaceae bacterium]